MTSDSLSFDRAFEDFFERFDLFGHSAGVDKILKRLIEAYGLRHAAYLGVNLPNSVAGKPHIAATYPLDWVRRYQEQSYHRHDPVILRGLDALLPIDWTVLDRTKARAKQLFGEAAEHGVGRHGLSFPIRGRHGERAIFTVTADETDQNWHRIRKILVRDLQIIAFHVHRLVLSTNIGSSEPIHLTGREFDCLQCAAIGKTQGQTAILLGISERTVICYLETARHKLDAANTTHAVAKAISMNILALGM